MGPKKAGFGEFLFVFDLISKLSLRLNVSSYLPH